MDSETSNRIEETVLQILKSSNLDEVSELKVRNMASQKLGLNLSDPTRKILVRQVVEKFLADEEAKREAEEAEEAEEDNDGEEKSGGAGDKEYDDDGDLIVCRTVMLRKRRRDGRLSQHVYGGQFGEKGTTDVLRMCRTACRRSK